MREERARQQEQERRRQPRPRTAKLARCRTEHDQRHDDEDQGRFHAELRGESRRRRHPQQRRCRASTHEVGGGHHRKRGEESRGRLDRGGGGPAQLLRDQAHEQRCEQCGEGIAEQERRRHEHHGDEQRGPHNVEPLCRAIASADDPVENAQEVGMAVRLLVVLRGPALQAAVLKRPVVAHLRPTAIGHVLCDALVDLFVVVDPIRPRSDRRCQEQNGEDKGGQHDKRTAAGWRPRAKPQSDRPCLRVRTKRTAIAPPGSRTAGVQDAPTVPFWIDSRSTRRPSCRREATPRRLGTTVRSGHPTVGASGSMIAANSWRARRASTGQPGAATRSLAGFAHPEARPPRAAGGFSRFFSRRPTSNGRCLSFGQGVVDDRLDAQGALLLVVLLDARVLVVDVQRRNGMDASDSLMTDGRGGEVDPHGPTASKCPGGKTQGLPRQTGRVQDAG